MFDLRPQLHFAVGNCKRYSSESSSFAFVESAIGESVWSPAVLPVRATVDAAEVPPYGMPQEAEPAPCASAFINPWLEDLRRTLVTSSDSQPFCFASSAANDESFASRTTVFIDGP